MIIDWIYVICLAFFLYRGYRKGVLLAIFSVIALLAGIAAALKLSGTFVRLLSENHPQLAKWAPFLVYLIIFLIVAWFVRFIARLLQKSMEITALGWLNRMSGAILYTALISMVYSIFLWLLTRMNFLSPETITASHTYPVLEPLAPKIMEGIGKVIPLFKDGFQDLNDLFGKLNQHISQNVGAH